jgi:hypothetical protein
MTHETTRAATGSARENAQLRQLFALAPLEVAQVRESGAEGVKR